jgi:hypothetical protein
MRDLFSQHGAGHHGHHERHHGGNNTGLRRRGKLQRVAFAHKIEAGLKKS